MTEETITIARRFHGPKNSGNGGYVCGRLARYVEGTARVRLYVPPPLEVPLRVARHDGSTTLEYGEETIAEAWPARLELEIPRPPAIDEARAASARFRGFRNHRFATCFVCGPNRAPGDGLRIFVGPVTGRPMVACAWTPPPELALEDGTIAPEYVWSVLDCPGGYAFPEPETGTILLGELTVAHYEPVRPGESHIVAGWEISGEGRKHYTGTALFSEAGRCFAAGRGIWFEVEAGLVE